MPRTSPLRSTTVRWALWVASALMLQTVVVTGFFWLQTTRHAGGVIDRELTQDCAELRQRDTAAILHAVADRNNGDLHRTGYAALFGAGGTALLGNLDRVPQGLVADGRPRTVLLRRGDLAGAAPDEGRAVACTSAAGEALVLGRDLDELAYLRALVGRAIALALLPALLIAVGAGALLSLRAQRRVGTVRAAIERIMAGQLRERLPVSGARDSFDRLSDSVNRMLDRIETLMEELRGIGDDIAHELRTPLTRLRAGLERGCGEAVTPGQFRAVGERALRDIDQALGLIAALLRIREIEQAQRRIEFTRVGLPALLRDAVELYLPMAEMRGVSIAVEAEAREPSDGDVFGDADLLMEAIANLLDNAVKFVRPGGQVTVRLLRLSDAMAVQVADDGPGIGALERRTVLRRFHRGEQGRRVPGQGIGLSLVSAIVTLHGFRLTLEDGRPGCVATIICGGDSDPVGAATGEPAHRTEDAA